MAREGVLTEDLEPLISSVRVAVVGTGALGSEFCRLLMEARHASVLLIDPDRMEEQNLAMSSLFEDAHGLCGLPLGMAKVEVVRRMAARRGLLWDAAQVEVADVGWDILRQCDLLVCCADSVLARVETAGAARSLGLPMMDGAVASGGSPHGRVAWFPAHPAQACYLCGLTESRRAEVLAYAISSSAGCLPVPEFAPMTGAMPALRRVAQELQAVLFELLCGARMDEAFLLRLETQFEEQERFSLPRSAGCPWHELPELVELPFEEPLRHALGDGAVLELFWPVCVRARCLKCGSITEPRRRTALVRRKGLCPACGPGTLEPLECVALLRAGDATARLSPRQLGLPERHLYYRKLTTVRP